MREGKGWEGGEECEMSEGFMRDSWREKRRRWVFGKVGGWVCGGGCLGMWVVCGWVCGGGSVGGMWVGWWVGGWVGGCVGALWMGGCVGALWMGGCVG